jgi:hypothetical protein
MMEPAPIRERGDNIAVALAEAARSGSTASDMISGRREKELVRTGLQRVDASREIVHALTASAFIRGIFLPRYLL